MPTFGDARVVARLNLDRWDVHVDTVAAVSVVAPKAAELVGLSRATIDREELVGLQITMAEWMIATLDWLDCSLRTCKPVSTHDTPETARARAERATVDLHKRICRLRGSLAAAAAELVTDQSDRVHIQIALRPEAVSDKWLLDRHRELHIMYADLTRTLGDEIRALSLPDE